MIDRTTIKKGDRILQVPKNAGDNRNKPVQVQVASVGKKYITVQEIVGGEPFGPTMKFYNDEHAGMADWSGRRLFFGNLEEYQDWLADQKTAWDLYLKAQSKMWDGLGTRKLSAILKIIEAPTLEDALAEITP